MSVFVVSQGTYEFRICAIFASKLLAGLYVDSFIEPNEEFDITEWPLDLYSKELEEGKKPYFIQIEKEGGVSTSENVDSTVWISDIGKVSFGANKTYMNYVCYDFSISDAIIQAQNKREEILSKNEWPRK